MSDDVKKIQVPKLDAEETKTLTEAAQLAVGGQPIDPALDEIFDLARARRERRMKRGEQSRAE